MIYVWTGSSWHQLNAGDIRSARRVIIRNYSKLMRLSRQTGFKWYAQDMPILAQQAKAWGYYWLGEIRIKDRD